MIAVMNSAYSQDTPIPLPPQLASKIDYSGDCWEWTGYCELAGYGKVYWDGFTIYAHRVMWEVVVGPIPEGLTIDHLCMNRRCVNPGHLRVISLRDNILASPNTLAGINVRKTHCIHGHPFNEQNTYKWRGTRSCRTCNRERQHA